MHTLGVDDTAQDAIIALSRHGIRHLPVTDAQQGVAGMVSERDLFALQSLSLNRVGGALREAPDEGDPRAAGARHRQPDPAPARQGVGARQLTELISHLNDLLTTRLIELVATRHDVDLAMGCLARLRLRRGRASRPSPPTRTTASSSTATTLGATVRSGWPSRDVTPRSTPAAFRCARARSWRATQCCLSQRRYCKALGTGSTTARRKTPFAASISSTCARWPERTQLAEPTRITRQAAAVPPRSSSSAGAELVAQPRAALDWKDACTRPGGRRRAVLDLKMSGTAIFVDVARLYALAHGVASDEHATLLR